MFNYIKDRFCFDQSIKFDTFEIVNDQIMSNPNVNIEWIHESRLNDQYQIHVFEDYTIRLRYGNLRSKSYILNALKELEIPMKVGIYEGGPDSNIRGIIEGFYGEPWSHEDRLDVVDFMDEFHMNAFFYAPKDDAYHRELWRTPYPKKEFLQLQEIIKHCQNKNIDFYFCISPGKDFNYLNEEDYQQLYLKIHQVINIGVSHISILFDDIDYKLTEDAILKYKRPGIAHAHVANVLLEKIKKEHETVELIMCPTEYYLNKQTQYIDDLKQHVHKDVWMFWTGYNTVAEVIPDLDGKRMLEYFGHKLLLWDNYPVNDMATHRLFLGPLKHRSKKIFLTHEGMISNPMIQWHASKIPLITMALFMWDTHAYNPQLAYEYAIKKLAKHDDVLFEKIKIFADEHKSNILYEEEDPLDVAIEKNDLNQIAQYYSNLIDAIDYLEMYLDKKMLNNFKPWIHIIKEDVELLNKMINKEGITVERLKDRAYVSGRNTVMKLMKKLNLIDDEYFKKKRINYWLQKDAQL